MSDTERCVWMVSSWSRHQSSSSSVSPARRSRFSSVATAESTRLMDRPRCGPGPDTSEARLHNQHATSDNRHEGVNKISRNLIILKICPAMVPLISGESVGRHFQQGEDPSRDLHVKTFAKFGCHLSLLAPVGLGQVGEADVVVPDAAEARQNLGEGRHDQVITVP